MAKSRVVIEFPTKEHRDSFLGWFSDGGGEYMMMESSDCHDDDPIVQVDYSLAYEGWGWHGDTDPIVRCFTERRKK